MNQMINVNVKTATGREYCICVCEIHKLECCCECFFDFTEMNQMERKQAELLDAKDKALQCERTGCSNYGGKMCARCKLVRYCSAECQTICWKKHKKFCIAVTQRDLPDSKLKMVGKVNIGSQSDEIVDVLPIGTRVALYHSNGETIGKIQAFNVGKGPFKDPLVRADGSQHREWLNQMIEDPCSCLPHYVIKCEDSSIELHEASSVHIEWTILDADRNPIINGADSVVVDDEPIDLSGMMSNFILVSGFLLSHPDCFYSQQLRSVLDEDDRVDSCLFIDIHDKTSLIEELAGYTCCVVIGVGSGGPQGLKQIYHEDLRKAVTKWVRAGGIFIIQGEGCICKVFKDWFELPWTQDCYERSETKLNKRCTSVPLRTFDNLPSSNSVKAVYLAGVKDEHNLYMSTTSSAVAFAPFGKGRVGFIGDVNAEKKTIRIIHELGLLGELFGNH